MSYTFFRTVDANDSMGSPTDLVIAINNDILKLLAERYEELVNLDARFNGIPGLKLGEVRISDDLVRQNITVFIFDDEYVNPFDEDCELYFFRSEELPKIIEKQDGDTYIHLSVIVQGSDMYFKFYADWCEDGCGDKVDVITEGDWYASDDVSDIPLIVFDEPEDPAEDAHLESAYEDRSGGDCD